MEYATVASNHEEDTQVHAVTLAALRKVAAALAALRAFHSNDPTHWGFVECLAEALAKPPPDVNAAGPAGASPLVLACARGDAAVVEELLSLGADPAAVGRVWLPQCHAADGKLIQSAGKYPLFPLTTVAFTGNITIAELLLARNGLDVNQAIDGGRTAMCVAAQFGQTHVAKLLLAHDAIDANKARTDDGANPLLMACHNGHDEVVKLLLAHDGVDANKARANDGATPLYMACQMGHDEVVKLMLAHDGIDANKARTDDGFTPLFMACQEGHDEVVKLMLAHAGIDANKAKTDNGCTPLYVACQDGHDEVVKLLLAHDGIDANKATTTTGSTPLFIACENGHDEVVRLLLAHDGIDANKARTTNGATPLFIACHNGHDEVVKLLLAHDGVDANKARANDGATPLYMACQTGHDEVVKLLLAHDGIDANKVTTDDGSTPLHAAVNSGNLRAAQHLVTCGADMNATDSWNETAAQYAAGAANEPILAAWLDAVARWSVLRVAAGCRFHRELAILLRQGRMDPDSLAIPEILEAIATSKTPPAALPWDDAPPVCGRTVALVADSTRGWHWSTHWLHHAKVREAVFTVLVVADRLYTKAAVPQEQSQQATRRRPTRAAAAAVIVSAPLPTLPPEIWLHCMGFVLRSWWAA